MMWGLPGRYVARQAVAFGLASLAMLSACERKKPPAASEGVPAGQPPLAVAEAQVSPEHKRLLAAAETAVHNGQLDAALASYNEARLAGDTMEARAQLSDLYKLMAMRTDDAARRNECLRQAEDLMRGPATGSVPAEDVRARVSHAFKLSAAQADDPTQQQELIAKGQALLTTPASVAMASDVAQRLREAARRRYEDALRSAAEAQARGDWTAAAELYAKARGLAESAAIPAAGVDSREAAAQRQARLRRQVDGAREDALDAIQKRRYADGIEHYDRAVKLAAEIRPPADDLLRSMGEERGLVVLRKEYDDLGAAWSEARKAGRWKDALLALRKMEERAERLAPKPDDYPQLAGNLREAEAEAAREDYQRLSARARDAQKRDEIAEAFEALEQARPLARDTKDLDALAAELKKRAERLADYLAALGRMAEAKTRKDLAAQRRAARDAVEAGRRSIPPPATLDRTARELAEVEKQAAAAHAEMLRVGDDAMKAGTFDRAVASYEKARDLAVNPAEVEPRLNDARDRLEEKRTPGLNLRERRQQYAARLDAGGQAEAQDRLEDAQREYAAARDLARDPAEVDACLVRVQERLKVLSEYRRLVAEARALPADATVEAHVQAWEKAVEAGEKMEPRPGDFAQATQAVAERRANLEATYSRQMRTKLEQAAAAEAVRDYGRALALYREARALTKNPALVDRHIAQLEGRSRDLAQYADALAAAQKLTAKDALRDRVTAWKRVVDLGEAIKPPPEDLHKHARTFQDLEGVRQAEVKAALQTAAEMADRRQFPEALARLEQARAAAFSTEEIDAQIAETRRLATRREREVKAAALLDKARVAEQVDDLETALQLYREAVPLDDESQVVRARMAAASSRAKALEPYRAAVESVRKAQAGHDLPAQLKAVQAALDAAAALNPPPADFKQLRETHAAVEKQRAARLEESLINARAHEKEGLVADALGFYRQARALQTAPDAATESRITLYEGLVAGDQHASVQKWPEAVRAYEVALGSALHMKLAADAMAPILDRLDRVRRQAGPAEATPTRIENEDEYRKLMASAQEAEKFDQLDAALGYYSAARRLTSAPAEIDNRLAAVVKRGADTRSYREALDRANEHLREERFAKALDEYRAALKHGSAIQPPPADLDVTRSTISAVERARDDRVAELTAEAEKDRRRELYAEALDKLQRARSLAADPKAVDAQVARIQEEMNKRGKDETARVLRQNQAKVLKDTMALANEFAAAGRWSRAVTLYEAALELGLQMRPTSDYLPEIRARLERARSTMPLAKTARNSIGMNLVLVAPGKFVMGVNDGMPDDGPAHEVNLTRPYYLGAAPVTNAQYLVFISETGHAPPAPASGPSPWSGRQFAVQFSDHPVTGVTYEDARAFCNWLTRKEEKTYRLPTEAEWEYACRAGTTTRYYWGDKPSPTYLNYLDSAINGTVPVGSYPPNAWKLHDMLGNASQWCLDWFGKHAAKPQTDPWGPTAGEARVLRGGWFRSRGEETTCGSRIGMRPDAAVPWAGFRVVMIPPERPAAAEGGK